MPMQRARRRAADLKNLGPVESSEVQALPTTIRMPKRSGKTRPVNVPIQTSVCTSQNQSEEGGQQISSPIASQLPTADQIAASLMQQLKDSGLQLINRRVGHPQYLVIFGAFYSPPLHNSVIYSTC